MPLKAILLIVGAVVCGIAASVLYVQEGSRLDVQKLGASVEGTVLRSWTTRSKRGSERHWVDYAYLVDGAAFKGEERHVSGFLRGPIKVWYDPASPDRCVSDPEIRYGKDLKYAFILAFVGVIALVYAGKAMLRRPPRV